MKKQIKAILITVLAALLCFGPVCTLPVAADATEVNDYSAVIAKLETVKKLLDTDAEGNTTSILLILGQAMDLLDPDACPGMNRIRVDLGLSHDD